MSALPLPVPFRVAALYRFAPLPDFAALRAPVLDLCRSHGIKGTLLLAAEGINGTVAGTDAAIAAGLFGVPTFTVDDQVFWGFDALPLLRAWIEGDPWFADPRWTHAGERPGAQRPR